MKPLNEADIKKLIQEIKQLRAQHRTDINRLLAVNNIQIFAPPAQTTT